MNYAHGFAIMSNFLFVAYLLWASWQDLCQMCVVRYTHLLGCAAIICAMFSNEIFAMLQMPLSTNEWIQNGWEIIIVIILQIIGCYFKCYGLADVFTICICVIFYYFETGIYKCLFFYFGFYVTAGLLLLVTQCAMNNVKGLNLKKQVPFIPYLSVAFFLTKWVI